jgi:hypothetical protein
MDQGNIPLLFQMGRGFEAIHMFWLQLELVGSDAAIDAKIMAPSSTCCRSIPLKPITLPSLYLLFL